MKTTPAPPTGGAIVLQPDAIDEGGFQAVPLTLVGRLVQPGRGKGEHLKAFVGDTDGVLELGR